LYFIDPLSLQVVFTLPITHFAHADVVCDRDDENRYRGKEVLIIRGEYKGWRGILRSKGNDSCDVEIGATKLATLKADVVVVR
jgi:transcription elongation factor